MSTWAADISEPIDRAPKKFQHNINNIFYSVKNRKNCINNNNFLPFIHTLLNLNTNSGASYFTPTNYQNINHQCSICRGGWGFKPPLWCLSMFCQWIWTASTQTLWTFLLLLLILLIFSQQKESIAISKLRDSEHLQLVTDMRRRIAELEIQVSFEFRHTRK